MKVVFPSSFDAIPAKSNSYVALTASVPAFPATISDFVGLVIPVALYSLPPIVTVPPSVSASAVKVAVSPLSTNVPLRPASCALILIVLVAPLASPFKRYVSLNLVVSATRSISVVSWSISDWIASLSVLELVPLEA